MDNERFDLPLSEEENWLDDILEDPAPKKEIGPDEIAVYSAGLTDPADAELERILAEHRQQEELAHTQIVDVYSPEATQVIPSTEASVSDFSAVEGATQVISGLDETQQISIPEEGQEETATGNKRFPRKSRPRIKKGYGLLGIPHILSTAIWAVIILAIGISLGRILWVCCADVMAFGRPEVQASVTIEEEDDLTAISKKLADAGLIAYPDLFKMFAEITGKDQRISVGTFNLGSHLDYNAMINAMGNHGGARVEVEVLFPEGINCAQVFRILEKNGVCTVEELEEYAANGELDDYWFLEGVQRGSKYCLEGYLAPDTYKFYTNDDPRRVIEKFLDGFDYRFTDLMKEKIATIQERYAAMMASHGYGQEYIDENPLTIREIVIIASLIEKETSGGEESYDIASVIYNRLTNQAENPFLNIDAALVYALGGKDELTDADKEFDSPYNTYKYPGLIPGPISNPGRDSLYAALDPNNTSYLYYALNPSTGKHHFTTNYNDHLAFLNSLEG